MSPSGRSVSAQSIRERTNTESMNSCLAAEMAVSAFSESFFVDSSFISASMTGVYAVMTVFL